MASTDVNKMVATVFGAVFVLVGILGFVMDPLLGLFETSLLHNLVHLLSGAALLAGAFVAGGRNARMALLGLGVVYALVTVLGFLMPGLVNTLLGGTTAEPAVNLQDNYLHLVLTVALLAVPLLFKNDAAHGRPTV